MRTLATLLVLVLLAVVIYWAWWRVRQMGAERSVQGASRRTVEPAQARWEPAHRQVEGQVEVLLRRVAPVPGGGVEVLEERAFDHWPDDDPMWEARFAESMASARHRCEVMNAEDA